MTIKFVPINLNTFEIEPCYITTNDVVRHALSLVPEAEIVFEPPKNEFYFLLSCGQLNSCYTNNFSDTTNVFYFDLLNKNCGLLLSLNQVESFRVSKIVSAIKSLIKQLTISPSLICYIDSNANIKKTLNRFKLKGSFFNYFDSLLINDNYADVIKNIEDMKVRSKKILLLGGNPRKHRLKFINQILQLPNFEEDNFISTAGGSYFDIITKKPVKIHERVLDHMTTRDKEQAQITFLKKWDLEKFEKPDQRKPNYLWLVEARLFTESYFQIVTSTWFDMNLDRIEINEKHARPMYTLQPFIVYGEPNTLQALKEMGYKTFNNWIDESYDGIVNDQLRFKKVVSLTESINAMSYIELSVMMKEMLPTLIHNIEHHNNRVKSLSIEYKLFNDINNNFQEYLTR